MKNSLHVLLQLNQIDTKIETLQDQKTEIPTLISSLQKEISQLENAVKKTKSDFADLQQQKATLESDIQNKTAWIETREPQTKNLSTNKEYQAALKELSQAKKEILDKEALLITVLEKIESVQDKFNSFEQEASDKIASLTNRIQEHSQSLQELENTILAAYQERKNIAHHAQENILKVYNKILERGTPVMTLVENGVCIECSTRVPPQLANTVQIGLEIILCPHCKRILYSENLLA